MDILNQRLTLPQFQQYIKGFDFGNHQPDKLVIHHTWRPTKESWQGERTILGLKNYYEKKGWSAGPHLFIAEDGIWLFTPMNQTGIHASSLNPHSIGIEVVGDYDAKIWEGETKNNALGVIKSLLNELNLGNEAIYFHRDVSGKSCPGWAITKEWLFNELNNYRLMPTIPGMNQPMPIPPITTPDSDDEFIVIKVPGWAKEAVEFVAKNNLFEIKTKEDLRDAVKFHRFYQFLDKEFPISDDQ